MAKSIALIGGPLLLVVALCSQPVPRAYASTFPGINGRIMYTNTSYPNGYSLVSMKPDGTGSLDVGVNSYTRRYPAFSKDGTKMVYSGQPSGGIPQIFISNADGSSPVQLTTGSALNIHPSFSPDGTKIIYSRQSGGFFQLWTMNVDGTSQAFLPFTVSDNLYKAAYSPDGTKILFESGMGGGDVEINVVNADGVFGYANLTSNAQHDVDPSWSPDGTKIVYANLPSGDYEIMVMDANGSNKTALTTNSTNEFNPKYSPDGTKIAFRRAGSPNEVYVMNANGTSQTKITTNGLADDVIDWQPYTVGPTAASSTQTMTVSGTTATLDVAAIYSDPYGNGIDPTLVTITTQPTQGSVSVNATTGVITYTQTIASSGGWLRGLARALFPSASAAGTDSFGFSVCSLSGSTLCTNGTANVNLALGAPNTGQGRPSDDRGILALVALAAVVTGLGLRRLHQRRN